MRLIVQKFGGSSVGTTDKIKHVAERVARCRANGDRLVVVVSAMQGETDRLLGLAQAMSDRPSLRERDQLVATGEQASAALLAMALIEMGIPARSMTGTQMGLRTDGAFSRARMRSIDRDAMFAALDAGEVIIATGFQGIDAAGNITTLGRGGSDTSAVGIAAALKADECEIYTDVLGVYTADPRICPKARKLDEISFDEMMEMASLGSKVLQIRSVELAMNHNIPVRVRSTFSDDPGTLVRAESEIEQSDIESVVRGVSHNLDECKVTLRQVPDQPGIAASIFVALAEAQINVDVIVQDISEEGATDLSFTVGRADRLQTEDIVRPLGERIGAAGVEVDDTVGKVSIVGVGMRAHPGVAAKMFDTLANAGVNILMITTSEIKVTCVVRDSEIPTAVQALHDAFQLDEAPRARKAAKKPVRKATKKSPAKKTAPKKTAPKKTAAKKAPAKTSAAKKKKPVAKKAATKKRATTKAAAKKKKPAAKKTRH